jgi:hypothetical protein
VETRYHNLKGGDADSKNWRQERESVYGPVWAKTGGSQNLRASVSRFYDEWEADARGRGLSVGQQAQAVQQSAFPDRYQERLPTAKRLLRRYNRTHGAGGTPSPKRGRPQTITTSPGISASQVKSDLRRDYLENMDGPDALLNLAYGLKTAKGTPASTVTLPGLGSPAKGGTPARTPGRSAYKGKVNLAPGADRAGVPTAFPIRNLLWHASRRMGQPITVTTGSNHGQFTTSGNVSAHWTGRGADIGLGGDARQDKAVERRGDRITANILIAAGVGRREAIRLARQGGVFNVTHNGKPLQVIWKTLIGGNHYNHVHAGLGT